MGAFITEEKQYCCEGRRRGFGCTCTSGTVAVVKSDNKPEVFKNGRIGTFKGFLEVDKNYYITQGINQAIAYLRKSGEMKAANKLEKGITEAIR